MPNRALFGLLVPDLAVFEDALADARADLADLHARRRADLDRRAACGAVTAEERQKQDHGAPVGAG